jgi:hypothetical protein
MITSEKYIEFVKQTFSFLLEEFKYEIGKITINGNIFYDVEFKSKDKIISISLETIENYIRVILFELQNGHLPDYDDKSKTIHLNELSAEILQNVDKKYFEQNNLYFKKHKTENEVEKLILKAAKDLRICLKLIEKK